MHYGHIPRVHDPKRTRTAFERYHAAAASADLKSVRPLFILSCRGGGGGAHSVVQEVAAMRDMGVDAAIAVQMVLALVEPQSSGLGGGAFLMHFNGKDVEAFERYMAYLKTYYMDYAKDLPESAKMYELLGLNLLRLLSQNRLVNY